MLSKRESRIYLALTTWICSSPSVSWTWLKRWLA